MLLRVIRHGETLLGTSLPAPGCSRRRPAAAGMRASRPSFLGLCTKQGVRFEQRNYQLAEGLGLKGLEGENRSELLLTVKITVQRGYWKATHVIVVFAEAGTML